MSDGTILPPMSQRYAAADLLDDAELARLRDFTRGAEEKSIRAEWDLDTAKPDIIRLADVAYRLYDENAALKAEIIDHRERAVKAGLAWERLNGQVKTLREALERLREWLPDTARMQSACFSSTAIKSMNGIIDAALAATEPRP
jgi:hypothetical protein